MHPRSPTTPFTWPSSAICLIRFLSTATSFRQRIPRSTCNTTSPAPARIPAIRTPLPIRTTSILHFGLPVHPISDASLPHGLSTRPINQAERTSANATALNSSARSTVSISPLAGRVMCITFRPVSRRQKTLSARKFQRIFLLARCVNMAYSGRREQQTNRSNHAATP